MFQIQPLELLFEYVIYLYYWLICDWYILLLWLFCHAEGAFYFTTLNSTRGSYFSGHFVQYILYCFCKCIHIMNAETQTKSYTGLSQKCLLPLLNSNQSVVIILYVWVFFTCGPRSRTLGSRSWRFLPGRRCWVSLKLWTPPSHGPGAYRTKQRPENQSHLLYKSVRVYDLVLLFHTLGCIRAKWSNIPSLGYIFNPSGILFNLFIAFDWIWICLGVHPKL